MYLTFKGIRVFYMFSTLTNVRDTGRITTLTMAGVYKSGLSIICTQMKLCHDSLFNQ